MFCSDCRSPLSHIQLASCLPVPDWLCSCIMWECCRYKAGFKVHRYLITFRGILFFLAFFKKKNVKNNFY